MRRSGSGGYICSYCRQLAPRTTNRHRRTLTTDIKHEADGSNKYEAHNPHLQRDSVGLEPRFVESRDVMKEQNRTRPFVVNGEILPTDLLRIALMPEKRVVVRPLGTGKGTTFGRIPEAERDIRTAAGILEADGQKAESQERPRIPSGTIKDWKPVADLLKKYRQLPIETRIQQLVQLAGDKDIVFSQAMVKFSLQHREPLAGTEASTFQGTAEREENFELSHWYPKKSKAQQNKDIRAAGTVVRMVVPKAGPAQADQPKRVVSTEPTVSTELTESANVASISAEDTNLSPALRDAAALLQRAKDLRTLLRIMQTASATPQTLLQLAKSLGPALRRCLLSHTPREILAAFGTIFSSLTLHDITPNAEYCEIGLRLAVDGNSMPAVQKYIDAYSATGEKYMPRLLCLDVLKGLVKYAEAPRAGQTPDAIRPGHWRRRDVLKILSGWSPAEISTSPSTQPNHTTFRDLLRDALNDPTLSPGSQSIFQVYITTLSYLRASDLIWSEWTSLKPRLPHFNPTTLDSKPDGRRFAYGQGINDTSPLEYLAKRTIRTFTLALLPHDPARAWELVNWCHINTPELVSGKMYAELALHPEMQAWYSRYRPHDALTPLDAITELVLSTGDELLFNRFAASIKRRKERAEKKFAEGEIWETWKREMGMVMDVEMEECVKAVETALKGEKPLIESLEGLL